MALQKHHDFAHDFLVRPGFQNALVAFSSNAVHFQQALGMIFNDIKDLGAERIDQPFGKTGSNAGHQSRPEVAPHALHTGGFAETQLVRFQLPSKFWVLNPLT